MKVICHSAKGTTWKKHKYISKTKINGNTVYRYYPAGAIAEGAHVDEYGAGKASDTYYRLTETGAYNDRNRQYDIDTQGEIVLKAIKSKDKDTQNVVKLMSAFCSNNDKLSSIRGIRKLNPVEKIVDKICNGGKKQRNQDWTEKQLATEFFLNFVLTAHRRKVKY